MAGLLRSIDFTFARGWRDDQLLRTVSRARLRGAIAEALVVESLLLRGFEVEPVKRGRAASPDIDARRGDLRARVEVYAPRTWEGLWDFMEDAKDWLVHLDEPFDFNFDLDVRHLRPFDEQGFARWFDAFVFSRDLAPQFQRLRRLAPILAETRRKLDWGVPSFETTTQDEQLDIEATLTVNSIRPAQHDLPDRRGHLALPPISGYAPEAIFENMLAQGLRKKLEQSQAVTGDALSVLAVDLSHLQIESELDHGLYQGYFREALERQLDPRTMPYDLVIFALPRREEETTMQVVFTVTADREPQLAQEFLATLVQS